MSDQNKETNKKTFAIKKALNKGKLTKFWFFPLSSLIGILLFANSASASTNRIDFGPNTWLEMGAGIRFDWESFEDSAPSGDDFSDDFAINRADLFFSGRANRFLKFTLNTTYNSASDDFDIREGVIRYEQSEALNIWAGRFMVPTDLSSLSTAFHQTRWTPVVGPFLRDEGVALWGNLDSGRFQYKLGVFDGFEITVPADAKEFALVAGRLRVNFWDSVSGYYTQSTYYGEKKILSAGVSIEYQKDAFAGPGPFPEVGDFTGVSADILLETNTSDGLVLTAQGTAFSYDTDDIPAIFPQTDGFEIMLAVMLQPLDGDSLGGRIQPTLSVQSNENDLDFVEEIDRLEIGLNYVMLGHDAKLSAAVANHDVTTAVGSGDFLSFVAGVQLMF